MGYFAMKVKTPRGITRWAVLSLLFAGLCSTPALALFPPPFFYPPGTIVGEPDPDPIIPTPPPIVDPPVDPPCDCNCPPGQPNNVPEPTTLISGLIGAAALGGTAWRKRRR
jgi:hypothetical protein